MPDSQCLADKLLHANETRFAQAFRDETGLEGTTGLNGVLARINQRRARVLQMMDTYGRDALEPELETVERFIHEVRAIAGKLERNEIEFVVFFDSLLPIQEVASGGHVKNFFEAGVTAGSYSKAERMKVEASLLGLEPDYYAMTYPDALRPKYGIIRLKGSPPSRHLLSIAKSYGAHALIFDGAHYGHRMTFSIGDSYDRLRGYVKTQLKSRIEESIGEKVVLPGWSLSFIPWNYRQMMGMHSIDPSDPSAKFDKPSFEVISEFKQVELPANQKAGLWYFEGQVWDRLDRTGLLGHEYYPEADRSEPMSPNFERSLKEAGIPSRIVEP